jgi:hypothetical protein
MKIRRLIFALSKTFDQSLPAIALGSIALLVCLLFAGAKKDPVINVAIMLTAVICFSHLLYWTIFHYRLYEVHELWLQGPWADPKDSNKTINWKMVKVGHVSAFQREVIHLKNAFKYANSPYAIKYGNIVVVGDDNYTYKDIEEVIRDHRARNGLRWNNNFPVGKGVHGFITEQGKFRSSIVNSQKLVLQSRA